MEIDCTVIKTELAIRGDFFSFFSDQKKLFWWDQKKKGERLKNKYQHTALQKNVYSLNKPLKMSVAPTCFDSHTGNQLVEIISEFWF